MISLDGNLIVSGVGAMTHKASSAPTGRHIDGVSTISDGKGFASDLEDQTVCVWDSATDGDGNFITSGSFDKTIRVWDVIIGEAY